MSTKSIKKNYFYNLSYQIIMLITPLVTAPYISRVLGSDGVGINSYTNSVAAYFTLVAVLGTADYGQREIAYRQDLPEERSRMFWEIFLLRFVTSSFSLLLYFLITGFSEYKIIYMIQAVNIISVAFDITWFFQGMEEFGKTVLRNIIVRLINIAVIFLFVKNQQDLPIYVGSIAFTILAGNVSMWAYLPKYIRRIDRRKIHPFRNLKNVLQLFIPQIAIQISAVLDKTMLGMLSGSMAENGYYEQADRIEKICLTIVSSLGTVMIPRISYIYAKNDIEKMKYYIYRAYRFVWMLAIPMAFGMILVADQFVPWFFGPGYEQSIVLIQIFSILLCLVGMSGVTGVQYFIPTGHQNEFTKSVVIGTLVNAAANAILIPRYLSAGAAIATIIGEFTVTAVQFYYAKDTFSVRKIIGLSYNYLFSGGIMTVILYAVKRYVKADILGTLILAVMGGSIYFIVLLIMKDALLNEAIKRFFVREKKN